MTEPVEGVTEPTAGAREVRRRFDAFVHRYDVDRTRPTVRQARGDALRRAFAPALALLAVIVGLGLLIVGPLDSLPGEAAVNETLQDERTPTLNTLTWI